MVQAKRKKSKPKKQDKVKQHGKQADIAQFRSQLDALGLKIIQVTSDGNCFFRSLADQLEGNEEEHGKYRVRVVQYIEKHREDFEPFIEDDLPFDEYCKSMEEDGTWAGHTELQAASLVTRSNICIHRFMSPRWYIRNFHGRQASMIHLSYHDGEHYNSVRLKEDPCDEPAKPIIIKVDADIFNATHHTKAAANRSREISSERITNSGSIKLVMTGTGCKNYNKVQEVLREVDDDVDAAIEFLIAEQETNETGIGNDDHFCETDVPFGDHENGNCKQLMDATQGMTCEQTMSTPKSDSLHHLSSQQEDKPIARNKLCLCGSKKKHKACCGSAKAKLLVASVINENSARKGRKETRNNNRKGESYKGAASHHGSAVTVLRDGEYGW